MFSYDSRDEKIKRFDRQIRAIGSDLMKNICEMTVMIVGMEGVKLCVYLGWVRNWVNTNSPRSEAFKNNR